MAARGTRGVSTLLTVVALMTVGAFLGWLYWRAQALPEPVTPETEAETDGGETVTAERLLEDLEAAVGSTGGLDSLPVAQRLGQAVFSVQLNGQNYPVLMNTQLLERQTQVYGGDLVSVQGQIYPLTDSIRAAWMEQGLVESGNEGDIPGTPSFLLADSVGVH